MLALRQLTSYTAEVVGRGMTLEHGTEAPELPNS